MHNKRLIPSLIFACAVGICLWFVLSPTPRMVVPLSYPVDDRRPLQMFLSSDRQTLAFLELDDDAFFFLRTWNLTTSNTSILALNNVTCLPALNPQTNTVAFESNNQSIQTWDWNTGVKISEVDCAHWKEWHPKSLVFSPEGRLMIVQWISGLNGEFKYELRDVETGHLHKIIFEETETRRDCLFMKNGMFIVQDQERYEILNMMTGEVCATFELGKDKLKKTYPFYMSADGQVLDRKSVV